MKKLFLAVTLALSACATSSDLSDGEDPRNSNKMTDFEINVFETHGLAKSFIAQFESADLSIEEKTERVIAALNDVTLILRMEAHGIYVEYTSADGRFYMWYPENEKVVTGRWGVQSSPFSVCFKFQDATHALTGEFEPNECVSYEQIASEAYVVDKRQGDVFDLSSKEIPYKKSAENLPPWPAN